MKNHLFLRKGFGFHIDEFLRLLYRLSEQVTKLADIYLNSLKLIYDCNTSFICHIMVWFHFHLFLPELSEHSQASPEPFS